MTDYDKGVMDKLSEMATELNVDEKLVKQALDEVTKGTLMGGLGGAAGGGLGGAAAGGTLGAIVNAATKGEDESLFGEAAKGGGRGAAIGGTIGALLNAILGAIAGNKMTKQRLLVQEQRDRQPKSLADMFEHLKKAEYQQGFMDKCAEAGVDAELVKQAFLGALGRAAKGGLSKLTGKIGGWLGRNAAKGGTREWLAKEMGQYSDDVLKGIQSRGAKAARIGKFKGGAKNLAKRQYAKAQQGLGISDRMAGLGVLGGGGLLGYGMLSGGGGQPQPGQMMNQYGQPFDPMAANINQRMVMPSGYGRMPTTW